MIQITKASKKATKKDIKKFDEKEWHDLDIEHYGKRVEWKEKYFLFKATDDTKLVGYVSGKHESGILYIDNIIVAHDYRGRGVGKALIDKVVEFGKKYGAHKVHLSTGKGWKAEKFYQALGFKKICLLPNHHFHKDFVLFEKFV